MAQHVGYFEKNIIFTEGPFVIVPVPVRCNTGLGTGWRIEAEMRGQPHLVLPDYSIFELCREQFSVSLGCLPDRDRAICICDWLNQQVQLNEITLAGDHWVSSKFLVDNVMRA